MGAGVMTPIVAEAPHAIGSPPADLPEECSHLDWQLACPRCFYEVVKVARGSIRADMAALHMEGAILLIWHMMIILADLEDQLRGHAQGIDLQKNKLARDLIANLHQLSTYMMQLGADPAKMQAALAQGAQLAAQAKAAIDSKPAVPAPEPSRIILTDR